MRKIEIHPAAKAELRGMARFYNARVRGLGSDFLDEFENSKNRIRKFPHAWPVVSENARKHIMRRFPCSILYQILKNRILIVAVMHERRAPDYWKDRLIT